MNRKEKLQEVKERAHKEGKEPFNFAKFALIYPHDTGTCERLKEDEPDWIQLEYEKKYYLRFPEAMTIEEFSKILDKIDESY